MPMLIHLNLLALIVICQAGVSVGQPVDPALMPVLVNTTPGENYGSSTRAFQGVPGIARSRSGRLWVTWYGGGTDEGPDNYVILSSSADDGRTWSPVGAVIDPAGAVRAFDPNVWVDPQGRLWWFYAQSYGWWDGRAGVWAVTTEDADKPSPQWSAPRRLADGVMLNKPTVLKNGEWLFPIAIWPDQPRTDLPVDNRKYVPPERIKWQRDKVGAHVYGSWDDGSTLTLLGTARFPNESFVEPMIVQRNDGSLWLWARTKRGIGESFSRDGGRIWTPGRASIIPNVSSRFFVRRLHSGDLLLVKNNPSMDVAWLAAPSIYNARQKRSNLTAYLSKDDGKTWQGGLLLDRRLSVSYPDGVQAPDGRIYIVYDYNRKTDKEIYCAVFTEADILAHKIVDPHARLRMLVNKATGGGLIR